MRLISLLITTLMSACAGLETRPAHQCADGTPRPVGLVTEARLQQHSHWRGHGTGAQALLSPVEVLALNERNRRRDEGSFQDVSEARFGDQERTQATLQERLVWLTERFDKGLLKAAPSDGFQHARERIATAQAADELRVVVDAVSLRCVPTHAAFYREASTLDRNQCSTLHISELVRVQRRSADGAWLYVHAGHSVGWLDTPSLTPPISATKARAFRDDAPRLVVLEDGIKTRDTSVTLRRGVRLPRLGQNPTGDIRVEVPTRTGLVETVIPQSTDVASDYLSLSADSVRKLALTQLEQPYGWGGIGGGRDCSRYLLDLFATFGVRLGRHSALQAKSGNLSWDVGELDEASKRARIREAASHGVVLLYMPGHIMLYLGQDGNKDYAVSAISEVQQACPDGRNASVAVNRIVVTDLEPGRGTKRRSFIERISRIAVFGKIR